MSGRNEQDMKYRKKNLEFIKGKPDILKKFFYSLETSCTEVTKNSHLYIVYQYMEYLEQNGYNINRLDTYRNMKKNDIEMYIGYLKNNTNKWGKPYGRASILTMFNKIKAFYQFLVDEEYIEKNPCDWDKKKKPKNNREISVTYLDEDDWELIQKNLDDAIQEKSRDKMYSYEWVERDRLIFMIGCKMGLRRAAISAIDISDIDFDENRIRVIEKGEKVRDCYFGEETKHQILKWLKIRKYLMYGHKDCAALFISTKRERLGAPAIAHIVKKYTGNITSKHITTHKLRATCATTLYEKTGDIYLVADVLGHSNIENTKRYANISTKSKKKAADILDESFE